MEKALIIVNADAWTTGQISKLSPVTERMVNALKNAIPSSHSVEVIGTASLWSGAETPKAARKNTIYCPLTIQLPYWLDFPAKSVFHACRNIEERRTWVADFLQYKICRGELSLVTDHRDGSGNPIWRHYRRGNDSQFLHPTPTDRREKFPLSDHARGTVIRGFKCASFGLFTSVSIDRSGDHFRSPLALPSRPGDRFLTNEAIKSLYQLLAMSTRKCPSQSLPSCGRLGILGRWGNFAVNSSPSPL
jgi:hypothetical protein